MDDVECAICHKTDCPGGSSCPMYTEGGKGGKRRKQQSDHREPPSGLGYGASGAHPQMGARAVPTRTTSIPITSSSWHQPVSKGHLKQRLEEFGEKVDRRVEQHVRHQIMLLQIGLQQVTKNLSQQDRRITELEKMFKHGNFMSPSDRPANVIHCQLVAYKVVIAPWIVSTAEESTVCPSEPKPKFHMMRLCASMFSTVHTAGSCNKSQPFPVEPNPLWTRAIGGQLDDGAASRMSGNRALSGSDSAISMRYLSAIGYLADPKRLVHLENRARISAWRWICASPIFEKWFGICVQLLITRVCSTAKNASGPRQFKSRWFASMSKVQHVFRQLE